MANNISECSEGSFLHKVANKNIVIPNETKN